MRMLGKLTASMRHMHCGFGSNNQGIIEDNRRKKRTTSQDTARGAAKASTSSEATEPICLRKDTRIVYGSDTRAITRPLSRPAPFWNFRDFCNAARPSGKTSVVATSGNAPLPMRPQDSAMPQRPAPRPTGYPSYPTALSPSTTSRRVPPRPILQNHAIPSTGPYSIPGFRPAPVYRMPAQRVTSLEITRQCHYRHRACCRICGTCGGCRCREKPVDQGA